MNFLNAKTTWTNAELIPFKLGIATAYILVGAYFHHFFHHYYIAVFVLFFITVIWTLYLWINKMKKENKE
jgi:hypothetical protein